MLVSSFRGAAGAAALLVLASCGGGGGGSTNGGGSMPTNQAPRFTSAATTSIAENMTGAYQASASDADGDSLTYSISGGADAALFTLSQSGMLSFATAPNFDLPGDSDGDNVYLVTLAVSDGRMSDTLNLMVTVTNNREGIQVRRVRAGFNQPLYVAAIPGDRRVFVLEKTGNIMLLDPVTGAASMFMDAGLILNAIGGIVRDLTSAGEGGLLGIAVHPDYQTNGLFCVYVTDSNGNIQVRRYRRGNDGLGDPRSGVVMLTIAHPNFNNHYGGWMSFGPDGYLYISTGDGGGAGDPNNNAQNPLSRLGKILRADVPVDPFAGASPVYVRPAPGNPYLGGGGDPYVYAIGLRNPFRASFHGADLLIGDVGQDAVEEVDLLRPQDKGGNYGWPFMEGTHPYRGTAPNGLIPPVTEYLHGSGRRQGTVVTGGYVYRGPVASLRDQYVFADYATGSIWTLPASSLAAGQTLPASRYERRNEDFFPDAGTIDALASFGEDSSFNLYLVDLDGEIYEVTAA